MIYLVLPTTPPAIAACEDEAHAAPYREKGYVEVGPAAFSAAWAERDKRGLRERTVGDDPYKGVWPWWDKREH